MKAIVLKIILDREIAPVIQDMHVCFRKGKMELLREEGIMDIEEWAKKQSKTQAIVVQISGYGVVHKSCKSTDGLLEKVVDGNDFIWERKDGKDGETDLVFIRKEVIADYLQTLTQAKLPVIDVLIGVEDDPNQTTQHLADLFQVRRLWQGDKTADTLCDLWLAKLKLPALAAVFLIVGINFGINSHLNTKYNLLQSELLSLRAATDNRKGDDSKIARFLQEYDAGVDMDFALLADKIAACIPARVKLSELSLVPLLRNLEKGKPLQLQPNTIKIKGEARDAESVTRLNKRLSEEAMLKQVHLTSLDKKRDSDLFVFEIQVEIRD
jgi:hypothetical protein